MKLLLISHNSIATHSNMGKTFLSMFSSLVKSDLCQFYIYPSVPDVDACNSYFRITDKDVLRFFGSFQLTGQEILPQLDQHSLFASESDQGVYRNPKNKTPLRMLARDLLWKFAPWYTKELQNWLDKEAPECIFVAPGTAKFLYDIALKVSKKRGIPIVTYVCDDYYFVQPAGSVLGKIQQYLLHRKIERLMEHTCHLVTICDEIKSLYYRRFSIPATTVMTGSNYPIADSVSVANSIRCVTYMGNIRCNRYHSLCKIGRALDRINTASGSEFQLKIYSAEADSNILAHFDGISSIKFMGYVSGEEFDQVFHSAEALLHTEAFDEASIDLVKHSVSTKIADSLGSGIPLLAYGPKGIASMEHLLRNNCAFCITEQESLEEKLLEFFQNAPLRKTLAENALKTAEKFHNQEIQSRILRERISDIIHQHTKNT